MFTAVVSLLGIGFVAVPTGILTSAFSEARRLESENTGA